MVSITVALEKGTVDDFVFINRLFPPMQALDVAAVGNPADVLFVQVSGRTKLTALLLATNGADVYKNAGLMGALPSTHAKR